MRARTQALVPAIMELRPRFSVASRRAAEEAGEVRSSSSGTTSGAAGAGTDAARWVGSPLRGLVRGETWKR